METTDRGPKPQRLIRITSRGKQAYERNAEQTSDCVCAAFFAQRKFQQSTRMRLHSECEADEPSGGAGPGFKRRAYKYLLNHFSRLSRPDVRASAVNALSARHIRSHFVVVNLTNVTNVTVLELTYRR
ncbi:hypothetical protein EVAR_43945_1 [Eumeta japonica]|uniref:Uncharacterized protein n=1 Tax=Eumeta variegata TaxID=151549 RepID=A0A4C1Y0W9_EUMVA|nr:hypothetical protein EVAR_43945_1 [Eumeta japonica]